MNIAIPPALLLVGSSTQTVKRAESYIRATVCPESGCAVCKICMQVTAHQYYALKWLVPEKIYYSVDDIGEVIGVTSFKLDENGRFFIVFEAAHLLSVSSANKLLKVIEEPPRGYQFILLAESTVQLLPTIVSRCVIERIDGTDENCRPDDFLSLLKDVQATDYGDFNRLYDLSPPNESQTVQLVSMLIDFWLMRYRELLLQKKVQEASVAQSRLLLFKKAILNPPMPGSAKLFWRTLYMEIQHT